MDLFTSSLPPGLEPCGRSAFTVKFLCVEKGQKQVQSGAGGGGAMGGAARRAARRLADASGWAWFLAEYKYRPLASL